MAYLEASNLPYKLIKEITNDFHKDRIIGSGGFGTVYKGVYENRQEVAVKVLKNISGPDDKEFQNELNNLRRLKHKNIVELVGFCNELEEELALFEGKQVIAQRWRMAFCFEYVHNGSLHKHISDENTGLTWHTRYSIIKGICEGLKYLHEELEHPVMHFDIKPSSILLDKDMVPKIGNFDFSRLSSEEAPNKMTSYFGTCGYWPPEYIKHQIISKEFDIFSLGVIIIKIMTGNEGYNSVVEKPVHKSVTLVHESWRKKLRMTTGHTSLEVYCNQVKRCIEIGLECLKSTRQNRPTIQRIVSSLNETEDIISDKGTQNKQIYLQNGELSDSTLHSDINMTSGISPDVEIRAMPWCLLQEMTNNFSDERLLGQGTYRIVYKGVSRDGKIVAVKKHHLEHGDERKFVKKIASFETVHHQNIVQFVGYCFEERKTIEWYKERHIVAHKINAAMCFEYLPNGSLSQYSSDMSYGLDWHKRYGIIKGICEGLKYLHEGLQSPILHMNLKLSNVFLDEDMIPKIGDFGMPRRIFEGKSRSVDDVHPNIFPRKYHHGHIPPEFIERQVISKEFDIYSLGLIIIELMTGLILGFLHTDLRYMCPKKVSVLVCAKWRERIQEKVKGRLVGGYCQQVKKCLEIAFKCVEIDRHKRPTISDIIQMLNETETLIQSLKLLHIHPLDLRFQNMLRVRTMKKGIISYCTLDLKNRGDDRVAFMLVANCPEKYSTKKPLCGTVPARSTYTLTLTTHNNKQQMWTNENRGDFFKLYSVEVGKYDLRDIDRDSTVLHYEKFFEEAKERTGEEVQEVMLKVLGTSCSERTPTTVEIITTRAQQVSSIDVHPTEPWIMTTHWEGSPRVWNHHTMGMLNSFPLAAHKSVHAAKFIAREKWVIAGDDVGDILVYNYENGELDTFVEAHESRITSLVVHPTSPFVLSTSKDDDHLIKLWDWGNGWKCTRVFQGHFSRVMQVMFNPTDSDNFASASSDGTVKIWSICSNDPNNIITVELHEYGLCVDYFTWYNRQHLIVGCKDKSAKILEITTKRCVYELFDGHEDHITAVRLHPELQMLITGSLDGSVCIWNSTTYKLENIIGFSLGAVYALGFIKGSRRIIVGCHQGIASLEVSSL